MTARLVAVALAVGLNVALAVAPSAADIVWVHPVAPPLTHLPEMGEAVLDPAVAAGSRAPGSAATENAPPASGGPGPHGPGPGGPPRGPPPLRGFAGALDRVVRTVGTPEQAAAVATLRGADARVLPLARRASELRVAIEGHAVALAEALGPERVGGILARKDTLSTTLGEGRAWRAARERLR